MKIVVIEKNSGELYVMPDTTLLRNNDPYYVPNFATAEGEDVVEGISVKITRLVKAISPRFAHRTWEEWSRCRDHRLRGVHHTVGRCFDRSFEVSPEWHPKCEMEANTIDIIDEGISRLSEYLQLRIGDYVFFEL